MSYDPDQNVTMPYGEAMTFLTDEPWDNGTEFVFGALAHKRSPAMPFSDLNKTETPAAEKLSLAEQVAIRMQLADGFLRHSHDINLDHLKELSQFVMTGRVPKPKEKPDNQV